MSVEGCLYITPTVIFDILGLIILTKVDSDSDSS